MSVKKPTRPGRRKLRRKAGRQERTPKAFRAWRLDLLARQSEVCGAAEINGREFSFYGAHYSCKCSLLF